MNYGNFSGLGTIQKIYLLFINLHYVKDVTELMLYFKANRVAKNNNNNNN